MAAAKQSLLVEDICTKGLRSAVKLGWILDGFGNNVVPKSEAVGEGRFFLLWFKFSLSGLYPLQRVSRKGYSALSVQPLETCREEAKEVKCIFLQSIFPSISGPLI